MSRTSDCVALVSALAFAGCLADSNESPTEPEPAPSPSTATPPEAEPEPEAPAEPEAPVNDPQWRMLVAKVGAMYFTWGQVDDEMRWAPGLCRMPRQAQTRFSKSGDTATHGDKLYLLYAKDPKAYGFPPGRPMVAVGPNGPASREEMMKPDAEIEALEQVLVKEAYAPVEMKQDVHSGPLMSPRPAQRDGKSFEPGDRLGVYVMAKVGDADTPGTDAGWIYGTVSAEGEVTSAGQVASCMGCHQQNEGRLFGVDEAM